MRRFILWFVFLVSGPRQRQAGLVSCLTILPRYCILRILDETRNVLRTHEGFFLQFLSIQTNALNKSNNKCHKQIKLPISLCTCAPISELPSKYTYHEVSIQFNSIKPQRNIGRMANYIYILYTNN